MVETILYIGSFVDDSIKEAFDIDEYSIAGNNKTENVLKSLKIDGKRPIVISPLFLNKQNFEYYSGGVFKNKEIGVDVYIPPHIAIFGINFLTILVMSVFYTLLIGYRERPSITVFYNYRLQRMVPAITANLFSTLVLQYEDARISISEKGQYSSENLSLRLVRKIEVYVKPVLDKRIEGAICTTTKLEQLAPTNNTAVVRGVPSVGYSDEMPSRSRDTDDIVVMFASKLGPARGIDLFLEATKKIDRKDVQFWIAGYGSATDQIKKQVAELADDRVEFLGLLLGEEYQQRLVDSDILVNFQDPSLIESEYVFPSKLLDFMSAQSVILSTDMSDLADCFSDKMVILEKGYEIHSLESVIDDVANDPSVYNSQIGEAKAWVDKQTRERTAKKIQNVVTSTFG